jgi:fatty-acyl-CoA synthase
VTLLVDDIAVQARLQPKKIAVIDLASDRRWTYAELDRTTGACARLLSEYRLQSGDRVAVFSRNHAILIALQYACSRLGLIYLPLNWRLTEAETATIIEDAQPALLVHDDDQARGCVDVALRDILSLVDATEPLASSAYDRNRPALMLYSSGTTGRPKGVMLSDNNLNETGINLGVLAQVSTHSCVLNEAPMFHVIGLVTNIRPYLMFGGTIIISDKFDPARTLAILADKSLEVTNYFCVPAMAEMLRQHPDYAPDKLKGLVALFTGGAPYPAAAVMAWLNDGIVLANGYGMSEGGTLVGMPLDIEAVRKRPMSAGVPTARVQLRTVDGSGRVLPSNSAGEIHIRGANVALGYWQRPEETAAAFLSDGWFATGDIGIIDDEGYVTVIDRKKDMYISGGENVYPAEVEAVVAEFDGIAAAAVIGVPDEKWGEVGYLCLVPLDTSFNTDALQQHLESRLARYKLPKQIIVLDELPRNGAGKILKAELRKRFIPLV